MKQELKIMHGESVVHVGNARHGFFCNAVMTLHSFWFPTSKQPVVAN